MHDSIIMLILDTYNVYKENNLWKTFAKQMKKLQIIFKSIQNRYLLIVDMF